MSIRTLIVDDEEDIRSLIRAVISASKKGVEVVGEAADGVEAVAYVDQLDPDVVILDQRMPGPSGIETAQQIFAAHPDLKIVLCSAFLDTAMKREAENVGIDICLGKGEIRRIPDVLEQLAG